MEISIIIPAYNEEKLVIKSLNIINQYLKKNYKKYEIIVVDDGSLDKTVKLIDKYSYAKLIRVKKNRGKGYAVMKGICASKYSCLLITDVDLATPIEMVEKLQKEYDEGFDFVIGSRNLKGSNIVEYQPFYRRFAGKAFSKIVQIVIGYKYADTQCGFKMINSKLAKKIVKKQTIWRWAFDVEYILIAHKMKVKIKEVSIIWKNNSDSRVSFIRDSYLMFKDMIKIKINDLKGVYD
jgi:dolichyl-phosphate beta-glucosyltransferase